MYVISAALVALLALVPFFATPYIITLILSLLLYIVLTESWSMFSGYTGYFSLGSVAFVGVGMYMAVVLQHTLPFYLIIPLAGLISAAVAAGIGLPSLRIRGPYFAILTLGISEAIKYLTINLEIRAYGYLGRPVVYPGIQAVYYLTLILGILTVFIVYLVGKSRFGVGLFAIRNDEDAAEASGIDTTRYKLLAFTISAIFPGFAGAITAFWWSYVNVYAAYDPFVSFQTIIMAILGGAREVRGPILGALVVMALYEILGVAYPFHYYIIMGIILIFIVRFCPTGIVGLIDRLRWRLRSGRSACIQEGKGLPTLFCFDSDCSSNLNLKAGRRVFRYPCR